MHQTKTSKSKLATNTATKRKGYWKNISKRQYRNEVKNKNTRNHIKTKSKRKKQGRMSSTENQQQIENSNIEKEKHKNNKKVARREGYPGEVIVSSKNSKPESRNKLTQTTK